MKTFSACLLLCCSLLVFNLSAANPPLSKPEALFIDKMVSEHQFNKTVLDKMFTRLNKNQKIITLMNKPYEAKPWYLYKKLFVTKSKTDNGVKFWRQYRGVLKNVSERTGVPPQIIVAIIGVESRYGLHKGKLPTLNALYTLAFHYPRRSRFFERELGQFLLLCREQSWNPFSIKGSYAGALGQPQFMPSSYRAYAKAYKHDNKINLFDNEPDVISSVANYFMVHGWRKNQPITAKAIVSKGQTDNITYADRKSRNVKPKTQLRAYLNEGVQPAEKLKLSRKAILLRYELAKGHNYWFGFYNFYVITRYNKSILYAMAVHQLADKIKAQYDRQYAA